jgi:hypothetical protein
MSQQRAARQTPGPSAGAGRQQGSIAGAPGAVQALALLRVCLPAMLRS